jgi:beta-aspartyl-peptidase (threonine type)
MSEFKIALHGGAGPDSEFIRKNRSAIEEGLSKALETGCNALRKHASAVDAVTETIIILEDNPLFNSGRGSALNEKGEVEMDASIMDGAKMKAGAVSMVRNVKNPVLLARYVMDNTKHSVLSGYGALSLAKDEKLALEPESYFVTDHQVEEFLKARDEEDLQKKLKKQVHGTVGVVAMDHKGNLASAASTGGTVNCLEGRIGDSSHTGSGCYANNNTCAVSGTGDGELLITQAIAASVSMMIEITGCSIGEALDYIIFKKNAGVKEDLGCIGIDARGNIAMKFNSERMHRAYKDKNGMEIKIYK